MANAIDNEKAIRGLMEAGSTYDTNKLISYYAQDAYYKCVATQAETFDADKLEGYWAIWFKGCKDYRQDLKRIVATDKLVFAEYVCHLTYTGGWPMTPPRAKVPAVLEIPVVAVFEMNEAGKIQSHLDYWDLCAVLTELGLLSFHDRSWTQDDDKYLKEYREKGTVSS